MRKTFGVPAPKSKFILHQNALILYTMPEAKGYFYTDEPLLFINMKAKKSCEYS